MFKLVLILTIFSLECSSLEKEKLEFEKEKLAFEKEKFAFEKNRIGVCRELVLEKRILIPETKLIIPETKISQAELFVEKTENQCGKFPIGELRDIWELSVEGDWYYHPEKVKNGILCDNDKKEFFYKQFSNTDSYVAETQVPATKKSSCINNVLFTGKPELYKMMIDKTIAKNESELSGLNLDKKKSSEDLIRYNTAESGRSFYYECVPTDKQKKYNSCKCALYASYPKGEKGILDLLKK